MSENILGVGAADFIGRNDEIEKLLRRAKGENSTRGLLVSSAPAVGATELLKQTYDKLFYEQSETIPVYFAVKLTDKTAKRCAVRFLQNLLTQTIAFRRQDAKFSDASPDVCELIELAAPDDKKWIEPLAAICENEGGLNDERAFVRNCLSATLRANANGANIFVMIDDLDEAARFADEINFIEELKDVFSRSTVPFVFAGRRRFLSNAANTGTSRLPNAEVLQINSLDFSDVGKLIENLAGRFEVEINEQTRDLIARQLGAKPAFIKFLIEAASEKKSNLDSFQLVEKVYADEVFGGKTGKFYDSLFQRIAPNFAIQKTVVGLLYDALTTEKTPIETWRSRLDLSDENFYKLISFLNAQEIIRLSSNFIEAMSDDETLGDYITARFRLEIAVENRAAAVGEMLSQFIKRAPKLMAKFYRRDSAVNLRELLATFDCRETPAGFLDYSIFRERYKGADASEVYELVEADEQKIRLPQIVYTAHTVAFYPPIKQVVERERSAIALGFEECKYTDEDETVWIAAEIDSKLEADRELAEFWCDRLEMVALNCNFTNYKLWLVAPEGFTPEASEMLEQRNAFGSSRRQIDLLTKFLGAESVAGKKVEANEYEIIVPMGEDTELIAAHTIEDIARRYSFEPKAINQIKTALVEACINATEHSLSPDRKIYQKFTIEPDKIVIKISNRGLRISDKTATEIFPDEGRRGWGLKLMQTLMDEVKFEQVDDGTLISMTKYLKK